MPIGRTLTADRGDAGVRVDLVLCRHLHDVRQASRTRVQDWIARGLVTVNGRLVTRPAARAAFGDVIAVTLPTTAARTPMVGEAMPLAVLYEDDHLLAVDKPPGIVVHPSYKHATGTLMNAVLWHGRAWPSDQRPSIVGRLDKLTSGVVLIAKTAAVHAALQRSLASAASEKSYLAVVYGLVNAARGSIDLRLDRDDADRRRIVARSASGVPSLTRFERLARVQAPRVGLSLIRCRLVTGRRHQIRVHLAARGWPIVGDPTYGGDRWSGIVDPALAAALRGFPRQALHAWRVGCAHPATREPLSLEAPIPRDLQGLLSACGLDVPAAAE